jgi:hypothetical protein
MGFVIARSHTGGARVRAPLVNPHNSAGKFRCKSCREFKDEAERCGVTQYCRPCNAANCRKNRGTRA